ncbi:MAG: PilT/PilU family type 4a pilus ATPase [Planctomycetota bacterium]|nr:MAG: PilT/PilU family type 4a pilus ATPase [Planctomycetota bacterium]
MQVPLANLWHWRTGADRSSAVGLGVRWKVLLGMAPRPARMASAQVGENKMKEVVLGLGHQSSLWNVVQIADDQLRSIHGSPKKMVVRADGLMVEAHRPHYEGQFDSFVLRLEGKRRFRKLDSLREIAAGQPAACDFVEEDGRVEIWLSPTDPENVEDVHRSCDALSAALDLPEVWRVHGEEYRNKPLSQELLFKAVAKYRSSDIHLYPGAPPMFRIDGRLQARGQFEPLSSEQIMRLIEQMAPEKHFEEFQRDLQCSFIFHQVGLGYARVSAFIKSGTPHCTLRILPEKIPSFEDLNIPRDAMEQLGNMHFGLILVTGMTGSGKSTTVASLVDWINQNKNVHILCIEQPVEFVHTNKQAVISQRDVGEDVGSFAEAVRGALRHDPDVIVIGEMRDPDTIRAAINAAATGHLVISTLHSGTSYETINRIVSFFDPVERDLVKLQLRDALKCVICQRLIPMKTGGRRVALEFMFNDTNLISDAILKGNSLAIKVGMQQTASRSFIFEKHLYELSKQEIISKEVAREFASESSILEQMLIGSYAIPSPDTMLDHH